jgi:HEXXH motif-containing protein
MIPRHETLTDSAFERLSRGAETSDDVTDILAYEAGINLVAVQFLKDYEASFSSNEHEAHRLWAILGEIQEAYPETFNEMWQYPLVTARWRQFMGNSMDTIDDNGAIDTQVYEAALLELGSVTGALAIQCNKPFQGAVAVHGNLCMLPTLGAITLQSSGGRAYLKAANGDVILYHSTEEDNLDKVYQLPPDNERNSESSIWAPIRRFSYSGIADQEISITLDDIDPFRTCFGEDAIRDRLTTNEVELWQISLEAAIGELVSGKHFQNPYPVEMVIAMLRGIQTLVPLKPLGTRMATSTSIDAVGAVGLSRAPDTSLLGEAMVHEYQHIRLTGLSNQHQLFEPTSAEPIHYAPWRGDARPVLGLLHGLYAGVGIMDYWQRQVKPGGVKPVDQWKPVDKWKEFHYSVWAKNGLPVSTRYPLPLRTPQ